MNYVLIEDDEQINEITDYMVKEKKKALKSKLPILSMNVTDRE